MFSSPNSPAQITIRLADERMILESPKVRESLAALVAQLAQSLESLEDVREKTNNGRDYAELRDRVIAELVVKADAAARATSVLREIAKRASIFVCKGLSDIDASLWQTRATIQSMNHDRLAELRKHLNKLAHDVACISANFDDLVVMASKGRPKEILMDIVGLCVLGVFLLCTDALVGWGLWRALAASNVANLICAGLTLGFLLGATLVCIVATAGQTIKYFRVTSPNSSKKCDIDAQSTPEEGGEN